MPQVTENILRFMNGLGNGGYDPIEAVKEHGGVLLTATQEYPEQADDIIIACIDAHGLEWIDALPKEMLETEAVTRRIARYKLTTPMEDQ